MPNKPGFIKDVTNRSKQFQSAINYFRDNPREKKLSRKSDLHLYNSYIKLDDGEVLALSSKHADLEGSLLGEGSFGRGKLAMDVNGEFYAVKIETTNTEMQQRETSTLANLGLLSHPKTRIKRTESAEKHYTTLVYLGKNLSSILLYAVDDEFLPSIARKIAWAVHELHSGSLSQDNTGYAHLDLRPGNIVIDNNNHIHLIDFGTAHPLNGQTYHECFTTSLYAPATYEEQQYSTSDYQSIIGPRLLALGPKNIDYFALKRTLFLPTPERSQDPSLYGYCLFSKQYFSDLPIPIQAMINTTDIEMAISRADEDTALKIAITFLAIECGIEASLLHELSTEEQEELCRIASKYSVPISTEDEEDDNEMLENHVNMKEEIQTFLEGKKNPSPR